MSKRIFSSMSLSKHFWNLITLWASTRWQGLTVPWVKEYPLLRGLNLPLGFIGCSFAFALPANMCQHILHVCWAVSGSYTPGWGVPDGYLGLNKAQLAEAELSEAWGTTVWLWGGRQRHGTCADDGSSTATLLTSKFSNRGRSEITACSVIPGDIWMYFLNFCSVQWLQLFLSDVDQSKQVHNK